MEDSELDHELTLAHLRAAAWSVSALRVDSEARLPARAGPALGHHRLRLQPAGVSRPVALDLLKAHGMDIPFVLVSGEIGEDTAVEAMRNGASDYLLKNNPHAAGAALLHAIEAAETQARPRTRRHGAGRSKQRCTNWRNTCRPASRWSAPPIAREIHDDVGGSLTALKFDLAWIARHTDEPKCRRGSNGALETVTLAIEASQRIMHNLRPAILEQGLVAALQWMTGRFERRTGVPACCARHSRLPALQQLPAGVPLVAYRSRKRRSPTSPSTPPCDRVEIDLALAGGVLSLEVSDNGRGLSQEDLAKARSFGIRGLHERARIKYEGWVDLSSGPGGTTLILSVPLQEDRRAHRCRLSLSRRDAGPDRAGEICRTMIKVIFATTTR
jgi:CheY-like chemotaxis protein